MVTLILFAKRRVTERGYMCPHCFRKIATHYDDVKFVVRYFESFKEAQAHLEDLLKRLEAMGYDYEYWLYPGRGRSFGFKGTVLRDTHPPRLERPPRI